jgi:hypothetical protein
MNLTRVIAYESSLDSIVVYDYGPMESPAVTKLAAELQRHAEEKFGHDRADALRPDVLQLARELDALRTYALGFEDEP